ncbi:hypothetical protein DUI87_10730 [Hirundo rustica rustica]|uniref:Reverse transcriptase domain-containing protein n=1 Tax=Hirundo rustica rustica TaxID=333673 RepID=A0A3M0KJF6_HIRRU|nr:hypothetical protein DUI87_10730 [Hirundo rustica rustica]
MEGREVIREQPGFMKGKSCLTNPVVFYDGLIASVEKGMVTDVIYPDFCKTSDVLLNNILLSKVEREMDLWVKCWIIKWLDGHIQRVVVNDSESQWTSAMSSIPPGSILGPV